MKILFGVQATGNGHICRSREIIRNLKRQGHDVHVLFSGRVPDLIQDTQVFHPYTIRRGLTFITRKGSLEFLKTAAQLNLAEFQRDIQAYDAFGLDLVITDFEPISARIAKRHGIPSIGIGHQYAFMYDVPIAKGYPLGLFILRNFAPADYMLGLHWHHFDRPILPPIVPDHFEKDRAVIENKILVYLPFEDMDEIRRLLIGIKTHSFYLYHGSCKQQQEEANLRFRPFSREGFLRDLYECSGVICIAGFELPSEALHLGKSILAKPLSGQIEQESNALALGQLGLATVSSKLGVNLVRDWLHGIGDSQVKPANYPKVAEYLAEWIGCRNWDDISDLVRSTWSKVD